MFLANFSGGNPSRPSFFEMIAQQEMMPTLRPALKYVFAVLAARRPRLEWFSRRSDEIFAILLLLLENHHLRHYDASFAENFYGLKRVRVRPPADAKSKEPTYTPVSTRSKYFALLLLVVIPYLKGKVDDIYRNLFPRQQLFRLDLEEPEEQPPRTLGWMFLKTFEYTYPILSALYEGSFFLYQLLYLYDRIAYYTPFLHLQKVILKRLSNEEMDNQALENSVRRQQRLSNLHGGPLLRLWRTIITGYDLLMDYAKLLLPLSIFAFKFLEWWYSETPSLLQNSSLPPPSAPEPPKIPENGLEVPRDPSLCPLCREKRENPALVPNSGFVYCYGCIYKYVEENGKCPISFIPCSVEEIRKIYKS